MDLKNRLCNVETHGCDRLHDWLLRIVGALTAHQILLLTRVPVKEPSTAAKEARAGKACIERTGMSHRRVTNEICRSRRSNLDAEARGCLLRCSFYRFHGHGLIDTCLLQLRDTVIENGEVLGQLAAITSPIFL